ncbi:alpha/beta hydrolase [Clostridium saccharoperbutylacetonicum]|uniref:alpha/beta hydrolase n=1 Tax=Clostridium saccharoperbutylacetonicum TaxID=36745 RepID=UPI0009838E31|nr:alpha/beta hydrolase family protein [Clostridium saccharoperbutylacetonicum]AQR96202.1 endo-1,4-beta-xylanase Z precursor [Clostridium saccharoperbutylacetonicum]NSB32075.1 S-formylglutathione hydrolase FrmB [Clostridium saccharoperbutylacetonicum]
MATARIEFFSKALMRVVNINVIIPVDKVTLDGNMDIKKEYKTLYLLHGVFGGQSDWLNETNIKRLSEKRQLVVVMPAGENKFYVDNEKSGDMFSQFIGEELVKIMRSMFPLSKKREDTFITGLSMGGYGALINGLKYSNTFGYIGCISPALVIDQAVNSRDSEDIPLIGRKSYFESVFGDLTKLYGSDKDYRGLIKSLKARKEKIPKLYMACGTEDFLIEEVRKYQAFLGKENIDITYVESPGEHDWLFWNEHINKILEWLPLEKESSYISSGDVSKNNK